MISKIFSREWLLTTFLVIVGAAVCVRLGIWQLDRLEQRRQFNAQFEEMRSAEPLNLNTAETDELTSMEWRKIKVTGEYDFENQVAIRNQYHNGEYGYHLVTPVLFNGKAILVDRGWIPADQSAPENWPQFDEADQAMVTGFIQLSQTLPNRGGDVVEVSPSKPRLEWYRVDIEAVQAQMPYHLLPVYLLQSPGENNTTPPYRIEQEFDLSDGPHLGYAIQWFIFSAILGVMYVRYVTKKEAQDERSEEAE